MRYVHLLSFYLVPRLLCLFFYDYKEEQNNRSPVERGRGGGREGGGALFFLYFLFILLFFPPVRQRGRFKTDRIDRYICVLYGLMRCLASRLNPEAVSRNRVRAPGCTVQLGLL